MDSNFNHINSDICTSILKTFKSINEIKCTQEENNLETNTGSYLINILKFPVRPYLNNIIYHTGNPPINFFNCNMSMINEHELQDPKCFFENVYTGVIPRKYGPYVHVFFAFFFVFLSVSVYLCV